MRKAKHLSYIAFLSLMLASCSVDGSSESLSLSEESDSGSVLSLPSSDDVSVPADSTASSSRSSRERNPFSLPASHYTVSIYQSYLIPGKNIYGNPRYDFSVTVEAGQPLYSTPDELNDLIAACNEVYVSGGGAHFVNGFYSDEACERFINYTFFTINSDTKVYYYCNG